MNEKNNLEIKKNDPADTLSSGPSFAKGSKKNLSRVNMKLTIIETDVLVIGGGFAGNFAAINAVEAGAKVVMAVKGRAGRSGLTPWANSWFGAGAQVGPYCACSSWAAPSRAGRKTNLSTWARSEVPQLRWHRA